METRGYWVPAFNSRKTRLVTVIHITTITITTLRILHWRHRTRNIITRAAEIWGAGIITAADLIPVDLAAGITVAGLMVAAPAADTIKVALNAEA